ncbi:hypothetical protein [uncultured Gammaproteobacteria bacterium]|nr:hypothetical protein [uncultured Gammaproteobacteria bacterium]
MNTVEAVTLLDAKKIEAELKKHAPDYADIWKFGLNVALRISDLLAIKYQALDLIQKELILTESKTQKIKEIRLNDSAIEIIKRRREKYPQDIYLFQTHSNRAKNLIKPISRVAVATKFKQTGDKFKLRISTHSMRKTRGKWLYESGVDIAMIAKILNHSSPAVTMRYIGIEKENILQTYDDFMF